MNQQIEQHKADRPVYGIRTLSENSIVLIFLVMFIVFSITIPYFFTMQNIWNILLETAITAVIAVGMTFVIIAGEIDLSVGSVLCLSGMVFATLSAASIHVVIGTIVTLTVGILIGMVSGSMVVRLRIPSFIVTLAVMTIARGAALLWRNGESVRGMTEAYLWFGQGRVLGVPVPVALLAITGVMGSFILKRTKLGLFTYAIGGNEEAARLSGINVKWVKTLIYGLTGLLAALSGIITASRLSLGSPIVGNGKELDAIAAVVLGGASLAGGAGSVGGTICGALAVTVLGNGLTLLRISSYWQRIVVGIVIILAIVAREGSAILSDER